MESDIISIKKKIIAGRSARDPTHISLRFKQRSGTETLKCLSSRILKVKGEKRTT